MREYVYQIKKIDLFHNTYNDIFQVYQDRSGGTRVVNHTLAGIVGETDALGNVTREAGPAVTHPYCNTDRTTDNETEGWF